MEKETQIKTGNRFEAEDVRGKAVLVTGGTTGIGRATAMLLAAHGARVMIYGREQADLNEALAAIRGTGWEAFGLTADQSKPEDIRRVFEQADRDLGGLDILVANAALPAGTVSDSSPEELRYVVESNLLGYMLTAREAVQRMRQKKSGQIVFVGSMSADVRETGSSLYVATKAGIQGMAEALRKEINQEGIRVSLVEPGETGSDMNPHPPEEQRQRQQNLEQLKAEDVAEAVYFCLNQPKRVDVVVIQVRPHLQLI